jgi:hypothetical protein
MEAEFSLPCSQQPVSGPYPDSHASSPNQEPFQCYTPIYSQVFRVVSSLHVFQQICVRTSRLTEKSFPVMNPNTLGMKEMRYIARYVLSAEKRP